MIVGMPAATMLSTVDPYRKLELMLFMLVAAEQGTLEEEILQYT
jgi:hypothetical protein